VQLGRRSPVRLSLRSIRQCEILKILCHQVDRLGHLQAKPELNSIKGATPMSLFSLPLRLPAILPVAALLAGPVLATFPVDAALPLLDDFSHEQVTNAGAARVLVNDQELGSQSSGTQACAGGVLTVKGSLVPGRGVPAFISLVLLARPEGQPLDLSAFEGIRLRVKVAQGSLSVQAASSEITNYDYHSGPIPSKGGDFQEVRIPFRTMKRAWSEQGALNLKTITSINVVAFSATKSAFSYELDEVGFY
jgi:hypothetical protein